MRVAAPIALSGEDRRKLDKWASSRSTPVRLRERSRIVLMAAEGMANKDIAVELGIDANKVGRWRTRYAKEGPPAIEKERPRGRQPWREGHPGAGGVARTGDRGDDADGAGGRHALVVPVDGTAGLYAEQRDHAYSEVIRKRSMALALASVMIHDTTPVWERLGVREHWLAA